MKLIYLDNNATTKVDEAVLSEMLPYFSEKYGNPSSIYDFATDVAKAISKARCQVMDFLGANDPDEIVFTSCGTESANMAIRGSLLLDKKKRHIVTTKVEHACVLNTYKWLEKRGYEVTYLGVNSEGLLDMEELKASIRPDTAIISVMWANNETGVVFPVEKIAETVKSINPETIVFVDGVQAAGKIRINLKETKIDMLGISGHKIHAPKGVGALYIKRGTLINPIIIGGHQERGRRAGTENTAGIVALGKAAEMAMENFDEKIQKITYLRDKLEKGILEKCFNSRVNGSRDHRMVNTTNISFEYVEGEIILLHLSDNGIAASSGSACTSGSLEPSHVLKAMGVPFTSMHGSIRFSLSKYTTEEEIDYTLSMVPQVLERLITMSPYQKKLNELKELRKR